MVDIHIHTSFSPDAVGKMENYILRAIELGMKTIGFSEHINLDLEYYKMLEGNTDIEAYFQEVLRLKKVYGDKIKILFGGEVGFDKKIEKQAEELIAKYPFDYIINSIHLVSGEDAWLMPFYKDRTKKEAYDLYLDNVYESLCASYEFNTVGHIGYVIRRAPYDEISMTIGEFGDKLDKIFKKVIELDVAIEINTKASKSLRFLPTVEILERYFELGGRKITYGSDSHDTNRLLDGYEEVKNFLLAHGITETLSFENGKAIYNKI